MSEEAWKVIKTPGITIHYRDPSTDQPGEWRVELRLNHDPVKHDQMATTFESFNVTDFLPKYAGLFILTSWPDKPDHDGVWHCEGQGTGRFGKAESF